MELKLSYFSYLAKLENLPPLQSFGLPPLHEAFDDGNGRIARAISDLMLTRSDGSPQKFYSMSAQILKERKKYYSILEKSQNMDKSGGADITEWLKWFLECLLNTLLETEKITNNVLQKADFWNRHKSTELNSRQRIMINKLLDGFRGKLKSSKWARITKCSADTALRDIKDLIEKGVLKQSSEGSKNTSYELAYC